jgi:hypothetical protein
MLERRRAARNYHLVPGEENDVELGDTTTSQETGVMSNSEPTNLGEELDQWDENAHDWEEDQPPENLQLEAGGVAEKRSD